MTGTKQTTEELFASLILAVLVGLSPISANAESAFEGIEPIAASAPVSGLRIAAWNIEHLGLPGESCLDRDRTDFAALRIYAEELNADIIGIQEIASLEAAHKVFPKEQYTVVLDERAFVGERPLCWGRHSKVVSETPLLGNAFTGFAIRRGVSFEKNPAYEAVGNLERASGSNAYGTDITVHTAAGSLRLLSLHLKRGCVSAEEYYTDVCIHVSTQARALRRWVDQRRLEGISFALVGDFNREWDRASPYWQIAFDLSEHPDSVKPSAEYLHSSCSFTPEFIDHVFLFELQQSEIIGFGQTNFIRFDRDNYKISDHCPVFADVFVGAGSE